MNTKDLLEQLLVLLFLALSSSHSARNRVVLKIGVLDQWSQGSESMQVETVKVASAWGDTLLVNITYVDVHTFNEYLLAKTVIEVNKIMDMVLLSDQVCRVWFSSNIQSRTLSSVYCLMDTELTCSKANIPVVDIEEPLSGDIMAHTAVNMNGSFGHLFSPLSLTEEDGEKIDTVLKHLHWSTVMIIYDDSTEFMAKYIIKQLEFEGIHTFVYNMEGRLTDEYIHTVLTAGYGEMKDYQRNFLLMCSPTCAREVMLQAEAFDRINKWETAMHYFSQWLIVSQSMQLHDERYIYMDINNIAVLALPRRETPAMLRNSLRNCLSMVVRQLGVMDFFNYTDDNLKAEARTLTEAMIEAGKQSEANITTLLWRQSGRQLSLVAQINKTDSYISFADVFPNSKMGFNRKRFKIGTLPWYPYIIRQTKDGQMGYVGYCIDLLEELAASLNFSYYWKEPDDGEWGRVLNGSWTGLVGQMEVKEVEMLVAPLGISAERELIMDFIFPFIYDYTAVLYKTPDPNKNKWRQLVDPFKWQVLVCIGTSTIGMGIIFWLLEKWNPFYVTTPSTGFLHPRKNFEDTILLIYGCLLTQGGHHTPRSSTGRVLISCWWIFCIVVAATYSGNLIAFLTVNKDKPPFETLMDLVSQTDYKWGTLGGSIWVQRFQTSNRTEFRGLWKGIEDSLKEDPDVLSLDQQVHLDKVDVGQYGFIADKSAMEISASRKCNLQFLKEVFYPIHYAIALPNNSPYFKLFSDEMLKVHESGLLQIWKRRWWPRQSMCKGSLLSEAKIVQLVDIQSAFYVIGIGIVCGLLCVLVEVFLTSRGRQRRRELPD